MESLHKNIHLMLEFLKALFLVLEFLLYINDLPVDVICNIAIYANDTSLYSKGDWHLICTNNLNWLLNLNLIYKTLWTGVRSGLLISVLGKLSWFHLTSLITMVLLM